MKSLDLTTSDTRLAQETSEFLCAVKFDESSKANYKRVLNLCAKADLFLSQEFGEKKKKSMHLAAFARTTEGAKLAYAVIEELRTSSWRFSLFANDKFHKNKFGVLNMLDCYCTSLKVKDYRAHCHKVMEDPYDDDGPSFSITIGPKDDPVEPTEFWRLPCQMLDGFVSLNRLDEVSPVDKMQAAAIRRSVNLCPRFKAEDFQLIKVIEPKSKRKFWD